MTDMTSAAPSEQTSCRRVLVDAGALQMVINALHRDAEDGRTVRGEMAAALTATIAAAPERAEPQPRLICSSNGLLGASSGVGRECDYWAGGVCTSPHPCQHHQQAER